MPLARVFHTGSHSASAPCILLIHGVGLSHHSFSRLAGALATSARVTAVDLPGFGLSPKPAARLSIRDYALAVADAVGPSVAETGGVDSERRFVVVGHSLGAQIALELALARPDLVEGVVLVGAVVDPAAPSLAGQARRLLRDYVGEPPLTLLMALRGYLQGGLRQFAAGTRSMLDYSIVDRIAGLTVPLLVTRGAADPVAPAGWTRDLAARVPGGIASEIPDSQHNVVHSRPTALAAEILQFVGALDRLDA